MAIVLDFIDLVVPIETIRQKYPGGWEGSELSASSIIEHSRKLYKLREQMRKKVKKIISI